MPAVPPLIFCDFWAVVFVLEALSSFLPSGECRTLYNQILIMTMTWLWLLFSIYCICIFTSFLMFGSDFQCWRCASPPVENTMCTISLIILLSVEFPSCCWMCLIYWHLCAIRHPASETLGAEEAEYRVKGRGGRGMGGATLRVEHYTSCHSVSHSLLETAGKMTGPCSKIWDHICKEAELELHRCAVIPANSVHMYPQVKGGL